MKSPSSTSTSMKLKTILHALIYKAESILIHFIESLKKKKKKKKKTKLFGSFRLHYNWCSSDHVVPVSTPVQDVTSHMYYDSTNFDDTAESQLSGYLHWLEEKVRDDSSSEHMNEIDRLADLFIASCHEKFMLEKQESNRRFQEMMARSV